MKIALASDVHLEFGYLDLQNEENADVLILSGDIMVAHDLRPHDAYNIMDEGSRSSTFHRFFQECSARFPHVVYVFGNHEHYHGDFAQSFQIVRKNLAYLKNVYILDKEIKEIDDVTFIGGTLWTDMNKEDPLTLHGIRSMMNDFRIVNNSNRTVEFKTYDAEGKFTGFSSRVSRFCPEDAVEDHKKMLQYIDVVTDMLGKNEKKYVVCGHHSPSKLSTKPQYENDTLMNGGYSSDLTEFILDRPCIKLWTHGHTHHEFDYMLGTTRIVCNPRGYIQYEEQADNFRLKYIDI
jgi:Icc-related predicted phosphoesterase